MIEIIEIEPYSSRSIYERIVDVRKGAQWVRILYDGYNITINPRGINGYISLIYRFEGGWLAAQAWAVKQLEKEQWQT